MKNFMGKKINIFIPPKFRRFKLQYDMKKNFNSEWAEKYAEELAYIKKYSKTQFLPYPFIEKYKVLDPVIGFDKKQKLPFVKHNQKRLYFPRNMSVKDIKKAYIGLLLEQDKKSPHRYFDTWEDLCLEESIFVDCGAAEGIISLDIIERVKQVYLIECSEVWLEPLKATFALWKDKVVLIEKSVGNIDSENICKLDTILNEKIGEKIIIKMDIEGAEKQALEGAEKILLRNKENMYLSVCTYHLQEDYKKIKEFLEKMNYIALPSNGYVLWYFTTNLRYPYFRRCLIRASGKNNGAWTSV